MDDHKVHLDYSFAPSKFANQGASEEDGVAEENDYPLYPHKGSILWDVGKGYDIYYDPQYESIYDLPHDRYTAEHRHFRTAYDLEHELRDRRAEAAPARKAKKSRQRSNAAAFNETPMYVRPYLEDPVFLEPDEVPDHHATQLFYDGYMNTINETPMYVRPYVEDPIFLQPDDDDFEVQIPQAHFDIIEKRLKAQDEAAKAKLEAEKAAAAKAEAASKAEAEPAAKATPSKGLKPASVKPVIVKPHHMEMQHAANAPNGYLHSGESCTHNWQCLSGKCISWLHKEPTCMPF